AIMVLSFLILKSAYYQLVLTQVLLWAVLSLGWNLLSGYSGYFSFGHAAFWGLGAYTVALGMLYLDLTPWISIPFTALVGAVAEAAGINTWRWKMLALMLSGAISAIPGGLYGVVMLVVTPEAVFGMLVSAQALILALFGGVGSLWGPVIGAMVLVPLAEGLNAELGDVLPGIQGVVYGIAIIAIILCAPEGVYWRALDYLSRRKPAAPELLRLPATIVPLPRERAGASGQDLLVLRNIGIS